MRIFSSSLLGVIFATASLLQGADTAPDEQGIEFFEKRVRPVLVKHCYECHSADADELSGNLAVDTRAGLLRGGDNGPAVVPGDQEGSFLMSVIRYEEDDYQMPPDGRLPEEAIADFATWIEMGAPDPRGGSPPQASQAAFDVEKAQDFWAFQPLARPAAPSVQDRTWPLSKLDCFILARLEQSGLRPAPDSEPRTFARRLYFDLVGLPPTPKQLREFEEAAARDRDVATQELVDRLISSPRFGERWGRHWLDVARYADSNGLDQNLTFFNAWRYRDYVIDAFNQDKPYRRFVIEQLAGDLLPFENDAQRIEHLVATGFLVVGPKHLSERDKEKLRMDTVDEQIDTVGKVFLGLTLGCARCHDHKFDPIPTRDYYALAGIFRSTRTIDGNKLGNAFISGWQVRPLPMPDQQREALAAHEAALNQIDARLKKSESELKRLERQAPKLADLPGVVVDDVEADRTGRWKDSTYSPNYIGKGYIHDEKEGKGEKSLRYVPDLPEPGDYEIRIAYTPGSGRAPRVPITVRHAGGEETLLFDQQPAPPIDNLFKVLGRFRFDAGRSGAVVISTAGTEGYHVVADAVQFLPVGLAEATGAVAERASSGSSEEQSDDRSRAVRELMQQIAQLETEKKALQEQAPPPAPMAMAVKDVEQPGDYRMLIRGNHNRRGDPVERGVVAVALRRPPPVFPDDRSGRLELARWIVDPTNPLTPRVLANRVWQHMFGEGLVRSVDNFGALGDRASHPELLDELAADFLASGWSVKSLVRDIALSRTYRLSTEYNARAFEVDPENRLHWRAHRRRLDAEVIRDAMLAVAGQLDLTMGGSRVSTLGEQALNNESKDPLDTEQLRCRAVYLPILRSDLPPVLDAFDFADPEMVTGRRSTTTVPTQALLLMNSPFVQRQATEAARELLADLPDPASRIDRILMHCWGRPGTPDERAATLAYIDQEHGRLRKSGVEPEQAERKAWASFCHAVLAATEFRFVE